MIQQCHFVHGHTYIASEGSDAVDVHLARKVNSGNVIAHSENHELAGKVILKEGHKHMAVFSSSDTLRDVSLKSVAAAVEQAVEKPVGVLVLDILWQKLVHG